MSHVVVRLLELQTKSTPEEVGDLVHVNIRSHIFNDMVQCWCV